MAETIQEFVEKIQSEGVEAGRRQADALLAEAKQQGEEILAEARRQHDKIIAEAEARAKDVLSRSQNELQLAARDAALRLRDGVNRALQALIANAVEPKLADSEFIGQMLHEIITQFSKSDFEGQRNFRINVPEQMYEKLVDWAMAHISNEAAEEHIGIDLKGTLKQVGFEYNATGATVEVTLESVVEVLTDLVSPKLVERLNQAMAGESNPASRNGG
ncbi:MAG: hypothetical protein J7M14_00270 [Planctomycetes bacterium]|nr:hypothetical protein [Planctomycetota bacterium]